LNGCPLFKAETVNEMNYIADDVKCCVVIRREMMKRTEKKGIDESNESVFDIKALITRSCC